VTYYWGALVGAYCAMWSAQNGTLKWWSPLIWVAIALAFEGVARLIRWSWRRHKTARTVKAWANE